MGPRSMAILGLIVALTVALSPVLAIPIGPIRAFPVQHLMNVVTAVLLGPGAAVLGAFLSSTLRLLLGVGTFFAYPGSLFGALLAGLFYRRWPSIGSAGLGEVLGTGFLGSAAAWLLARFLLGGPYTAAAFFYPFLASTLLGAAGAVALLYASRPFQALLSARRERP